MSICVCLQAFLKSEVSAENILFWQECEKFRKIPATSLEKVKTFKSVSKCIYLDATHLMPFIYVFKSIKINILFLFISFISIRCHFSI